MFLLYAVAAGLLVGFLIGGRPAGLATLEFRWPWLAIAGFAVQIALFSGPIADRVGETAGSAIYVASTAAVFIAVLRNARIAGLPIVALGAASNLAAIVANGGHMPTSAAAAAAAGRDAIVGYSNSAIIEHPNLAPLTDVFALPPGLPMSNVFSIGDVLIAVGIATTIALAMRRRAAPAADETPPAPESGVHPDATTGPESA